MSAMNAFTYANWDKGREHVNTIHLPKRICQVDIFQFLDRSENIAGEKIRKCQNNIFKDPPAQIFEPQPARWEQIIRAWEK